MFFLLTLNRYFSIWRTDLWTFECVKLIWIGVFLWGVESYVSPSLPISYYVWESFHRGFLVTDIFQSNPLMRKSKWQPLKFREKLILTNLLEENGKSKCQTTVIQKSKQKTRLTGHILIPSQCELFPRSVAKIAVNTKNCWGRKIKIDDNPSLKVWTFELRPPPP